MTRLSTEDLAELHAAVLENVELRRALRDLTAALRLFADETGPNGNKRCEGGWGTGYICGFDDEGEPIPGFTEFCRYCAARAVLSENPKEGE